MGDIMDIYESEPKKFISFEQWENIFNSLEVPMMIINDKQDIIRINNSMKCNVKNKDNIIGEKCYKIVHGTFEPPENCPHLKTIKYGTKNVENIEIQELNSWFRVTTSPTYDSEGNLSGSAHVAQDITDLIITKNELEKSLELKDLLMSEIHHRVQNNLVTVASLLYLQALNTNDTNVKNILMDAQSRTKAMSIMYQKINSFKEFEKIELKYYFQQLLDEIVKDYPKELKYFLDVHCSSIDVDTTLILGLIINELVSNSLKYAFSDKQRAIIKIIFQKINNQYILKISDNGKLRKDKIDINNKDIINSKSFGITMVTLLTEQLNGQISVKYDEGTIFTITFNEK